MPLNQPTPITIVIDFDKTIVDLLDRKGYRHLIQRFMEDACKFNPPLAERLKEITPTPIKVMCPDQEDVMLDKLQTAFIAMQLKDIRMEVFVYSSCDYPYVTEIVEYIEKEYHFSFARPILTNTYRVLNRSTFDNYYGLSVFQRIPDILTALLKKYPMMDMDELLTKKILFVDNYKVIWNNLFPHAPLQYGQESVAGVPDVMEYIPLVTEMQTKVIPNIDKSQLSLDYMTYLYKQYVEMERSIVHHEFFIYLKSVLSGVAAKQGPLSTERVAQRINRYI